MTTQEILNSKNSKGIITMSNENADWYAISKDGMNMITLRGKNKFYKTQKSWATKISQMINKGA